MDPARLAYLALTLLALAFPVRRFVMWVQEHGLDLTLLWHELTINEPARSVTGAVFIASIAVLLFIVGEAYARRDWWSLVAVPVTLMFGVGVGLPFYLFLRLRQLR